MERITTDPLAWITGAIGNTASAIILWYFSYCYGTLAACQWDDIIWWGAPIFLPASIISGCGLLLAPLSFWVLWALISDTHNKYVLLSINIIVAALIIVTFDSDYYDYLWYTIPMLLPCGFILYRSSSTPLTKMKTDYAKWKKQSLPNTSLNPLNWLTASIGHTFTSILLTVLTFIMGYIAVSDPSYHKHAISDFIHSVWIIPLVIFLAVFLWTLLKRRFPLHILYSISIMVGAVTGGYIEGNLEISWFTLPVLAAPTCILFATGCAFIEKTGPLYKRLRYRGIQFDED